MTLNDFVRDSLTQISQAVKDAQASHPFVAPAGCRLNVDSHKGVIGPYGRPLYFVDFDVAVTTSREASATGEAKGSIISVISGGVETNITSHNSNVSRLKFTVPMIFNEPGE